MTYTRRRLIEVGGGLIAAPLIARPGLAQVIGSGISGTEKRPSGHTLFPGSASNLVGFNNTPASPAAATQWQIWANNSGAYTSTWPGAFSSLTPWPGGTGNLTINSGAHAQSGAGTPTNPYVFAFYDFNSGTGGVQVSLNNCVFVGCRFQSNDAGNYNVQVSGSTNVAFIYCSFVPLVSLYATTPGAVWPSAGAIQNTTTQVTNVNCINGNDGFQTGISVGTTGPITADHCDCWGFGNSFSQMGVVSAGLAYVDCWVHDSANASPQGYHQDGIGYVNGGAAPSNILIQHCTVASLGNTNAIAFQGATSPYANIAVKNCYLGGFGNNTDMGAQGSFGDGHANPGNTGMVFTGNTFGTDVQWINQPLYTDFTVNNNYTAGTWNNNKLAVAPGTSPASGSGFNWTSGNNGNFIWPNQTLSTSDWPG